MQLSHHCTPPASAETVQAGRRERGYILVTFAMLLVPLLLMVGLSVDVGSWYNRASDVQKAADAGALAGVVWLPDTAKAATYARAAASRNGFTDGVDGVTVTVTPTSDTRLRVTITDTSAESPFAGNLGIPKPEIGRKGTAEYVLPVPLGSPENRFGNNPLSNPPYEPNLWASISAPYTEYKNGDPYSTKCSPNGGSGTGCTQTNPEYRDYGYLYVVDVPSALVGRTLDVKLYDAGNYSRPNYPTVETADIGSVNTMFEMYRPDSTPLDIFDGLTPTYSLKGNCSKGPGRRKIADGFKPEVYKNQWRRLCKINVTTPGQYVIQVKSSAIPGITDSGNGWNQFSLQAKASGPTQPTLFTTGDLSLFNNLPGLSGNQQSNFYLAKIEPNHKGKTLIVSLFDPGDGGGLGDYFVNLLGPGAADVACKYRERGAATFTNVSQCRIPTRDAHMGVDGDGNPIVIANNVYNGKWLDIQVAIPNNYTCSSDCWWKVRYDFFGLPVGGSGPNDRTVWAARVIGDPVHLIEE